MANSGPAYLTAEAFIPPRLSLKTLREAAAGCQGCDLYQRATQTVFGAGPAGARMMIVGETPGDQEDRAGKPFVGPAGRLLDQALDEAGITRDEVYITNAVKHFKWAPRGKRRIHGKPTSRQIAACKPWLSAEVEVVKPKVLVALGATAAGVILGKDFRLTQHRGEVLPTAWAQWTLATIHPSALLRMRGEADHQAAFEQFVSDLKLAATHLP